MESIEDDEMIDDSIQHIGIKRRSGRYPWGSGRSELQRSRDFKSYYDGLKKQGLTDKQITGLITEFADKVTGQPGHPANKFSTTDLRAAISNSTDKIYAENVRMAVALKSKGMGTTAIADRMGLGKSGESTVRGWLKASEERKESILQSTANTLKEQVHEKEFLDVGKGTHLYMGVADTKLRQAIASLKDEGYGVYTNIKLPQLGTADKFTTYKVLTKPGVTWKEAKDAVVGGKLRTIAAQSDDGGATFKKTPKDAPVSLDVKRIEVAWKENGGHLKDGVIELRRGVEDLSLGSSNYAQVRIAVGKGHYLKGMAMYADDLPKGVDVRFNTNKSQHDPKVIDEGKAAGDLKYGAMKAQKIDKGTGKIDADQPFGASIRRTGLYTDKHGKEHASPLNIVNEEGRWDEWSKSLSSQMLSKQSLTLAATQLNKGHAARQEELGKIKALTNPVVREKLLHEFAEQTDAAAVHLKAAAIERQKTQVILPINTMRPTEVYAPRFEHGEKVVLVRHPHGGPFEIPELTVNNRNLTAKRILGGALDAIGIHHSVAEQLSGADFDGDTVLVIPNNNRKIKTQPMLEGLKNFDPKTEYAIPKGDTTTKRMSKKDTQREMGKISNLITDMSLQNAPAGDIVRAVRHSMVVIDAEKHELNYKLSEQANGISQLKTKYQGGPNHGAATIISRTGAEGRIPKQKQLPGKAGINPKTGEKVFVPTGQTFRRAIKDKNGKPTGKFEIVENVTKGPRGSFVKDARELLSGGKEGDPITAHRGQPMERIYADYSNAMRKLANEARKEQVSITMPRPNKTAATYYAKEVTSLKAKLTEALKNAPLERRAQAIGNAMAKAKIDANPGYDKDDIKKVRNQALEDARLMTEASKRRIGTHDNPLTDREWEAIQAGAVSVTTLREILRNADMDRIRTLSTPRPRTSLSTAQISRARQLKNAGLSVREISDRLGLPPSTIVDNLK